ncbi:hypothetical protein LCGC14_1349820 [marine sediment metagenome]|uniref:Prohead serine protease domain-containing protein n=1 Tax=marine sediment metagenome TaxID=412755 RepID=A0A0F9KBC6_9ZZZZ
MAKKLLYKSVVIKGFEELEKKQNAQVEQADVSVLASTEDTDRDMEVIKQDGIDLTHFLKNPVILFAHNYSAPPIGKAISAKVTDAGLQVDIKFASKKANPLGPQIRQLMKEGILKAVSIGFIPKERDENDPKIISKSEMLELSVVPVPANPHALALAVSKGFSKDLFRELKKKKVEKGGHKPDKPKKPKKTPKQETTEVQTLILNKEEFPTRADAVKWARDHDFRSDKVDETEESWRLRQFAPGRCQDGSFRTIELTDGVQSVICRPKKGKDGKEVCESGDVNKTISAVSEKLAKEPNGKKNPPGRGERSGNGLDVIVELPRAVVVDLRKETLKAYKQNELVLTMTKSILHKMYEKENSKDNQIHQK